MKKPIIGITSEVLNLGLDFYPSVRMISLNEDYQKLISSRGGLGLILPIEKDTEILDSYIEICDGFLFTGGADINPIFYGENPHSSLGMLDNERDEFEIELMKKALDKNKPVFAICRGMQIMNIALGGSLIQDIESQAGGFNHLTKAKKYDIVHRVDFKEGSLFEELFGSSSQVNSSHHQALGRLGEGLIVEGRSQDKVIEAVRLEGKTFAYGVQWHPEGLVYRDERMNSLTDRFLEAAGVGLDED